MPPRASPLLARIDDIVEGVYDVAKMLMQIDAKLQDVIQYLRGDDDEEEEGDS